MATGGGSPKAQGAFIARIREGSARVYRIGGEFVVLSELPGRGCDRIEFRSETFLCGSAAVLVGQLLDEMRALRRGVEPDDSAAALERSLLAVPREGLHTTSATLWRALARADLIESIIDSAAGHADYTTRRVAIHRPLGRDNAPYVLQSDGGNLRLLAAPWVRAALVGLLLRDDAQDAGAARARFERRGKPARTCWMQFRREAPALAQAFLDRFGPPFFGELRRQPSARPR
ncbi:MAG: hypothetical protein ACK515_00625 [bacterium]|jgi:hypothetical protein|nr:hypothetical protein [Betaproteobacteria bacterium]